jgi:hypothetical protein
MNFEKEKEDFNEQIGHIDHIENKNDNMSDALEDIDEMKEIDGSEHHSKTVLPMMMDHHSTFVGSVFQQDTDEQSGRRSDKGWTIRKEQIVRRWQTDVEKASFVFGERLDNIANQLQRIQIISLAGSSLVGVLAVLGLTLGAIAQSEATRWTIFAFNCTAAAITGFIAFSNTKIHVLALDYQIRELSKFVGELNRVWVSFDKELMVPFCERMNADEFLTRNASIYGSVMERCPDLKADEYIVASQTYQQRLADNLLWTKRFRLTTDEKLSELSEIVVDEK